MDDETATQLIACPAICQRAIEETRDAVDFLLSQYPENKKTKKLSAAAADHLRKLFPHLDDMTLAAFAAYIVANVIMMGSATQSTETLLVAVTYAYLVKELAWQLWEEEKK